MTHLAWLDLATGERRAPGSADPAVLAALAPIWRELASASDPAADWPVPGTELVLQLSGNRSWLTCWVCRGDDQTAELHLCQGRGAIRRWETLHALTERQLAVTASDDPPSPPWACWWAEGGQSAAVVRAVVEAWS